jgi:hypothetical protein
MVKPELPELANEIEMLATAALLSTLRRATRGIKIAEANACATLMAAYRDWTEASRKDELIERAVELKQIAQAVGSQSNAHLAKVDELLAANKASRKLDEELIAALHEFKDASTPARYVRRRATLRTK